MRYSCGYFLQTSHEDSSQMQGRLQGLAGYDFRPIFVGLHFSRSVTTLAAGFSPDCFFFENLCRDENIMATKLGMEFDFHSAVSCNGLICSWSHREKGVSVSNPIIGKRITLPESQKKHNFTADKPI